MTRTNHSATRLPWALAVAILLATALTGAPPAFGSTSKIKIGKPAKTGRIWIEVALRHANGTPATVLVPIRVDGSWSAETKASYVEMAFDAVADANKIETILDRDLITFRGKNNWYVDLVGVAKDSTGETDVISLGLPTPVSDQEALCSLAGTASGTDSQGGPGFVRLQVGETTITQQTWAGMPSAVVEQILIGQLNAAGIPARFATPNDFAGSAQGLDHDNEVIWFPVPDTTGFLEQISDVGLDLDLAVVLDGTPNTPSSAPAGTAASGLRLDACPTILSGNPVQVRFAAAGNVDRIHLEVFDVAGKKRCTLFEGGPATAGAVTWDGRDERQAMLPGGVYFVRLSSPVGSLVRRVVRVRE
jgi:hypothetical protein